MIENRNDNEKMFLTMTIDIPKVVFENIEKKISVGRKKSIVLRQFLKYGIERHYNLTTQVLRKSPIILQRDLPFGESVTRFSLTIALEQAKALDILCQGTPLSRKSLAEFLIVRSYKEWETSGFKFEIDGAGGICVIVGGSGD